MTRMSCDTASYSASPEFKHCMDTGHPETFRGFYYSLPSNIAIITRIMSLQLHSKDIQTHYANLITDGIIYYTINE
jgi:hypothetical protein